MSVISHFTVRDAVQATGLTCTMIDYLCRQKLIRPSKSVHSRRGKSRYFSFFDLLMMKVIKSLLDQGIKVSKMKKAFERLEEYREQVNPSALPAQFIVTDGIDAYFSENGTAMNKNGQYVFSFVMDVSPMHKALVDAEASFREKRNSRWTYLRTA